MGEKYIGHEYETSRGGGQFLDERPAGRKLSIVNFQFTSWKPKAQREFRTGLITKAVGESEENRKGARGAPRTPRKSCEMSSPYSKNFSVSPCLCGDIWRLRTWRFSLVLVYRAAVTFRRTAPCRGTLRLIPSAKEPRFFWLHRSRIV